MKAASAIFQEVLDEMISRSTDESPYLDDIIVIGSKHNNLSLINYFTQLKTVDSKSAFLKHQLPT